MNPALYFIFFFFLVANVIALPGVRETRCTSSGCQSACICDYEACEKKAFIYANNNSSIRIYCARTYECGTC